MTLAAEGSYTLTIQAKTAGGNTDEQIINIVATRVDTLLPGRPRLALVESVTLSSFLGIYGAGRVVRTFSLLPGEKTKISVRTFTKRDEDRKQSTSILDSVSEESD